MCIDGRKRGSIWRTLTCGEKWVARVMEDAGEQWQGWMRTSGRKWGWDFFIGPKAPLTTRANNESGAEDGAVAKPRLPRLRMVRHALVEIRQTGDSHGGTTKS